VRRPGTCFTLAERRAAAGVRKDGGLVSKTSARTYILSQLVSETCKAKQASIMKHPVRRLPPVALWLVPAAVMVGQFSVSAQTLPTHRIPAALALEAASETVAACARQGYHETAIVLDADGATIAALRGDGAGIHTLDSAHDKAYTAVSFRNDTLALAERAKGEESIAPLAKLPHVMFFGGGVVIKLGDEVVGGIGAAGAPGAKLDDNCAHAGLDKIRERLQ
jgi:uncharacterized protein GlcG (DUF336 family)